MLRELPQIPPTIAVDPGAGASRSRATGIVAIDGLVVVHATSLRRGQGEDPYRYAQRVVRRVRGLQAELDGGPWKVVVESVVSSSSHIKGRRSKVTPDAVVGAAIVSAAVWVGCQGALVRPDHHGQAHKPEHGGSGRLADYYPPELIGRRPEAWQADPGTREHEQSAYDIAHAYWQAAGRPHGEG
jgi:hypothetical protein